MLQLRAQALNVDLTSLALGGYTVHFQQRSEFLDPSATSEGWHVQWQTVPPGEKSEPRSLGCIREGNEAGEAN
jgi:hypothetical protein